MLARLIISFAYFLDSSKNYCRAKSLAYDILENPKSRIKPYFDTFIIFLVFVTVSILIYDIAHNLTYHFILFENMAVIVFILEWLGRFWISSSSHNMIIEYHKKSIDNVEQISAYEILKMIFS